ncbi:MAG: hypothetical protein M8467_11495 [Anaerolineae bacterium]|nr:hypothetical protein [Anaerolineae bacterium]
MNRFIARGAVGILLVLMALLPMGPVAGQLSPLDPACGMMAFSTEEDFITQGPEPADGNPIISDGDLLALATDDAGNVSCILCARNADLLQNFDLVADLGLDAVDVVDTESYLVAFSTELNGPNFTQGDLLATNGAVIPNRALTWAWGQGAVGFDTGLDAVHFVGDPQAISGLLSFLNDNPLTAPSQLSPMLEEAGLDILFSTEAGWSVVGAASFLDGDLLSARDGVVVAANSQLLPASVPAGIPDRGVDFGLDAFTTDRFGAKEQMRFSTELLFDGDTPFTDGDVLRSGDGIDLKNRDLVWCFEPKAEFLGLDALHVLGVQPQIQIYLPVIFRSYP